MMCVTNLSKPKQYGSYFYKAVDSSNNVKNIVSVNMDNTS